MCASSWAVWGIDLGSLGHVWAHVFKTPSFGTKQLEHLVPHANTQLTKTPKNFKVFESSGSFQPNSDGFQPNSVGFQPNSDGFQPNIAMASNLI